MRNMQLVLLTPTGAERLNGLRHPQHLLAKARASNICEWAELPSRKP